MKNYEAAFTLRHAKMLAFMLAERHGDRSAEAHSKATDMLGQIAELPDHPRNIQRKTDLMFDVADIWAGICIVDHHREPEFAEMLHTQLRSWKGGFPAIGDEEIDVLQDALHAAKTLSLGSLPDGESGDSGNLCEYDYALRVGRWLEDITFSEVRCRLNKVYSERIVLCHESNGDGFAAPKSSRIWRQVGEIDGCVHFDRGNRIICCVRETGGDRVFHDDLIAPDGIRFAGDSELAELKVDSMRAWLNDGVASGWICRSLSEIEAQGVADLLEASGDAERLDPLHLTDAALIRQVVFVSEDDRLVLGRTDAAIDGELVQSLDGSDSARYDFSFLSPLDEDIRAKANAA